MFLKRITLTGFKSFAAKTTLDLEPGLTAVVGPNGSGKSNLADAVRWALGEQSKGRLRLDDREHIIFAGTEERARASFADVTLLFDNEDGSFPLNLTEVEISRRLYRSGESDYRLAGRSVPLREVQALLAQAGFGAGSYAVIGQGTIDTLLLSSPAERKLLFDEAAGIRGPELGREAALRKLTATEANLTRLRDLEAELSPRLETLERITAGGRGYQELAGRVAALRRLIAATAIEQTRSTADHLAAQLHETTTQAHRLRHEQTEAQRRFKALEAAQSRQAVLRRRLQDSLVVLERTRDAAALALAERRAALGAAQRATEQVAALERQLAKANTELAGARERQTELEAELATTTAAAARAQKVVERAAREVSQVQEALVNLRQDSDDGTRDQYVDHALQVIKTLATSLGSDGTSRDHIRLLVHKAGRLLSHASRSTTAHLLTALQDAQQQLEAAMSKRETAVEHQTNITITQRSLDIDAAHQREATARAAAHVAALQAELVPARAAATQRFTLQQQMAKDNAALDAATATLEHRRLEVRELETGPSTSQTATAAATAVERTTAAGLACRDQQAHLTSRLAEAKAAWSAARVQAAVWGLKPADLADEKPSAKPTSQLQSELVHAEAQLEARTTAQREQLAEYEALEARTTQLRTQITDLETAAADLQRVVAELATLIQARFKDNFQALATQFSDYFARLFEGGSAALKLEEGADGTYGITITASPKGKRLASLTALSGGERSLAGVALLAAILHVNPSPFVVLDEIDAALDEANSGRLAAILAELQARSQLIVITHNRQTMQAARVLYGVTSTPRQASRLLSMRLEEATQLAAR